MTGGMCLRIALPRVNENCLLQFSAICWQQSCAKHCSMSTNLFCHFLLCGVTLSGMPKPETHPVNLFFSLLWLSRRSWQHPTTSHDWSSHSRLWMLLWSEATTGASLWRCIQTSARTRALISTDRFQTKRGTIARFGLALVALPCLTPQPGAKSQGSIPGHQRGI